MAHLALGFILGICFGSFFNTLIDRLPRGQSLIRPASRCPACGTLLKPKDLLPVLSYLWLRGRCRYCGARIPRRLLTVELVTGLLFAFFAFSHGPSVEFLILAFFTSLFLVLAIIDLELGIVPDKIVYPGIGISLVMGAFWSGTAFSRPFLGSDTMLASFLSSLGAGVLFSLLFLVIALASRGGMGWGDVKMAGLVGLAVGLWGLPTALLTSLIAGGLVAGPLLLLGIKRRKDTIPFAPFLSLGGIIALLWSGRINSWYLGFIG